jgi:hypothetical protein
MNGNGKSNGKDRVDATGCITIQRLKITAEPAVLTVTKAK